MDNIEFPDPYAGWSSDCQNYLWRIPPHIEQSQVQHTFSSTQGRLPVPINPCRHWQVNCGFPHHDLPRPQTLPRVAKVTPENSPPCSVRCVVTSEIKLGLFSPRNDIITFLLILTSHSLFHSFTDPCYSIRYFNTCTLQSFFLSICCFRTTINYCTCMT